MGQKVNPHGLRVGVIKEMFFPFQPIILPVSASLKIGIPAGLRISLTSAIRW